MKSDQHLVWFGETFRILMIYVYIFDSRIVFNPLGQSHDSSMAHLVCCGGARSLHHGHIRYLHWQVIIINKRPRPLHLARLELVLKSPKVRVSKQATEQVAGPRVLWCAGEPCACDGWRGLVMMEATVVVAGLDGHSRVRGGRGSIFGAVPLAHEVTDAQHGRVENQVAPAAFGGAVCAARVGPQRLAELGVKAIQRRVQVRRERDEVCGALLDTALWSLDLTFTCERTGRKRTTWSDLCAYHGSNYFIIQSWFWLHWIMRNWILLLHKFKTWEIITCTL